MSKGGWLGKGGFALENGGQPRAHTVGSVRGVGSVKGGFALENGDKPRAHALGSVRVVGSARGGLALENGGQPRAHTLGNVRVVGSVRGGFALGRKWLVYLSVENAEGYMCETVDYLTRLALENNVLLASPPDTKLIIRTQQDLRFNHLPQLPDDFVELLHHVNLFECDGVALFGVNPRSYYLDVFAENVQLELERHNDILVLGRDEFSFLIYNAPLDGYQIVDKDNLAVVKNCKNLLFALHALFKR